MVSPQTDSRPGKGEGDEKRQVRGQGDGEEGARQNEGGNRRGRQVDVRCSLVHCGCFNDISILLLWQGSFAARLQ